MMSPELIVSCLSRLMRRNSCVTVASLDLSFVAELVALVSSLQSFLRHTSEVYSHSPGAGLYTECCNKGMNYFNIVASISICPSAV
jgi:hypothetical protein